MVKSGLARVCRPAATIRRARSKMVTLFTECQNKTETRDNVFNLRFSGQKQHFADLFFSRPFYKKRLLWINTSLRFKIHPNFHSFVVVSYEG